MSTTWFISATFLPYTGEPIDFLLEERGEPIHGTFANGMFQTRLANYETGLVRSWREAVVEPTHEVVAEPPVGRRRAWVTMLKKVASLFPGGSDPVAPTMVAPNRQSSAVRLARPVGAISGIRNQLPDSNQISS